VARSPYPTPLPLLLRGLTLGGIKFVALVGVALLIGLLVPTILR
jgi:hypothetical protein